MAEEFDYKKLAEAIREGSGGNSTPTQSRGGDVGGLLNTIKTGLGDLAGTITPLYAGFQRLAGASGSAASVLEGFSKVAGSIGLGGLGSAVEQVGNSLLKNKAQMDEAGKIGVGGNDLGKFNRMAAESGQKVGEFTETIVSFKGGLNGLSGNAQRSAETFSKLSGEIQQGALGKQLRELGIESNELANITALSVQNSKKLNLDDAETRTRAKASANELAHQLAETALTTGMSRDAILNSVKAEQEKPKVMLAMLAMDEQQRQNFTKTQASLAALGPTTQALASEIVSGGIRTKEGMAAMTALGPAGEQLQRAIKQQQEAKTVEQKTAAAQAREDAKTAVNTRMASKEYGQIANTATGATAEAMAKMAGENKSLMGSIAATQEAGGDAAKAAANQKAEAVAAINGIKVDKDGKSTGQDDPGKKLSQTINEFDRLTNIQAAGLARNFEIVNNKLGASPEAIKKFTDALDLAAGKTSKRDRAETYDQAQAQGKGVLDDNQGAINKATGKLNEGNAEETPEMRERGNVPGQKLPRAPKKADGGLVPGTDTGTTVTVGEKGAPEAIVPLDALRGMMASKEGSGINIAEISKTISTTLSSASSSNEGPKVVQNDESKAASKELANVKAQYAAEREVLLQKTKAELGPDAGPRQVRNAMRDSDEGKAIEEKFKALKAPLYKQIEDGISWETAKKSQQAEETIASLKEQENTGYAANRAAALARDALEEKAELESRAMTQSEEAQYKLLGIELNASSDKITAAQTAQTALNASQQAEVVIKESFASKTSEVMAKVTEGFGIFAPSISSLTKELEAGGIRTKESAMQMSLLGPAGSQFEQALKTMNLAVTDDQKEKAKLQMQQAESAIADRLNSKEFAQMVNTAPINAGGTVGKPDEIKSQMEGMFSKIGGAVGKPEEIKSQMEGMFSKLGGAGGMLGDMFNPKIIDTKLAEANKAKLAEVKKEEPKPAAPAPKPAETKPAETKPANTEIGIKDLNDQLKMLNMNMLKLIDHSETISGSSTKTAKNSAKATGNRYA